MTIAVGVACPEGLVLAADSRSSLLSANKFRIATDHAQKVFEIGDAFAAVTFGWSTVLGKTIAGAIKEIDSQTQFPADIDSAARTLRDAMKERIDAHIALGLDEAPPYDSLGFIMGGFDANGVGHIRRIALPSGTIVDGASTMQPGAHWDGETDAIVRLVWGWDLLRIDASGWAERNRKKLEGVAYNIPVAWFALQDAVDFAAFVVRTTIDTQRFIDGTVKDPGSSPTCGGPLQIVTVTSHGGVEWVQQTKLRGDFRPLRAEGGPAEP
jgi:hypothetical protein